MVESIQGFQPVNFAAYYSNETNTKPLVKPSEMFSLDIVSATPEIGKNNFHDEYVTETAVQEQLNNIGKILDRYA
ncbi:MAG: hypothetical protein PHV30_03210 [Candidatus Margulisbacteria bacterium]|nr:hypothetical protein [Candidatus Margulisiibacteriota bacterium]